MSVILEAKSISKKYEKGSYVLKDISLDFHASQFVAILGHSGSGKTTLLNVLSTILKPTSGKVFFKGKDITKLNKKYISELRRNEIGFVFQNYLMLSNLTVRENILVGIAKDRESIEINVLSNLLGIDKLLDKLPHELSGGEQQRVAIARAIIKRPTILFCDEATGALDEKNSKNIVSLLHKIKNEYGVTVLFATHNKKIASTADRILTVKDGQIIRDEKNTKPTLPENMNWEI